VHGVELKKNRGETSWAEQGLKVPRGHGRYIAKRNFVKKGRGGIVERGGLETFKKRGFKTAKNPGDLWRVVVTNGDSKVTGGGPQTKKWPSKIEEKWSTKWIYSSI